MPLLQTSETKNTAPQSPQKVVCQCELAFLFVLGELASKDIGFPLVTAPVFVTPVFCPPGKLVSQSVIEGCWDPKIFLCDLQLEGWQHSRYKSKSSPAPRPTTVRHTSEPPLSGSCCSWGTAGWSVSDEASICMTRRAQLRGLPNHF